MQFVKLIEGGGDWLVEEKRGHVRITLDVDVNEEMMEILKESISKMPEMARKMIHSQKKKEEWNFQAS